MKRSQINNDTWNLFVDKSPQQSIYSNTWYLDCICKEWMAIVVSHNEAWLAIFPLNLSSKFSIDYSIQPILAQYLGILYAPFTFSMHKELNLKKKIINEIIHLIPNKLKIIDYNFSPNFKYFLPFQWKDFQITPKISYQLNLHQKANIISSNYSTRIKNHIKKAKKNNLICIEDDSVDELLKICQQNKLINNTNSLMFQKFWKQIILRKKGFCLYVVDENGNVHSGGAFIIDRAKIIFILLSTSEKFKKYGATSYLINESIYKVSSNPIYKHFDFKGSMIESIETFFRGFNAYPVMYYSISKNRINTIFNIYQKVKLYL